MNDTDTLNKYAAGLERAEPSNYTKMPNILFHCTYLEKQKDGSTIRKKVSPRFRDFYHFIRMIATTGSCWMTGEHMAEQIGCSPGTISTLKKEGLQPIEQLDNKPLFTIETKKKRIAKPDGTQQTVSHHKILVTDIWGEAAAFMAVRKEIEELKPGIVHNNDPSSNIEGRSGPSSNIEERSPGASSNIEGSNRNTEKDLFCEQKQKAAAAASYCSSKEKLSVTELAEKMESDKDRAYLEMRLFGCDNNMMDEMMKRFMPKRIIDGIIYSKEQQQRGKILRNLQGYARCAIEQQRIWTYSAA